MNKESYLGDYSLSLYSFPSLESILNRFKAPDFVTLHQQIKYNKVGEALLALIDQEQNAPFLLPAVTEFISRIRNDNILEEYTLAAFEFWLNNFAHLSDEKNLAIRGKIVGKQIPRDAYQVYFPIGMGKKHPGSHFVAAHTSPDLDTTVASFWGFVDAFAARVSEGLHIWNVPGGAPKNLVELDLLFHQNFGEGVFDALAKTRTALTLSALDLVTQEGLLRKHLGDQAMSFDHERKSSAVVLVDEEGYYLGDWRSIDVEGVRQIILALNNCLRWLEGHIHIQLISLFSAKSVTRENTVEHVQELLQIKLKDCEPAAEFTLRQQKYLQDYLIHVLEVEQGIDATFAEFATSMEAKDISSFSKVFGLLEDLSAPSLFGEKGDLSAERPELFTKLKQIVTKLSETFREIRGFVESLQIALEIKTKVLGYAPQYVTYRTDVEEIKSKMNGYTHLTVNYPNEEGSLIPVGVIYASDIQKSVLGTVTLRDFCNREEVKIPPYLEIISVIDHHKATLTTSAPVTAYISDAQSSNAAVAELAFQINDMYSTSGMSVEEIDAQLQEEKSNLKLYSRLIRKKMAAERSKGGFSISVEREFLEYLHFVYAILDDTDLLTKVSRRDIECVAELLNRMKTISKKREVEIVSFDDIDKGSDFVKEAAKRLLQNEDFYSLYSKVYASKESAVEENIQKCLKGDYAAFFADTKVLATINRVSQSKIFAKNYESLSAHREQLIKTWITKAESIANATQEIDFYLHMVSTVSSAEELHQGVSVTYDHKDELWFWIPNTPLSIEHLQLFLSNFKQVLAPCQNELEATFFGPHAKQWSQLFKESFLSMPHKINSNADFSLAMVQFPAGILNSRKAKVAPHLATRSSN